MSLVMLGIGPIIGIVVGAVLLLVIIIVAWWISTLNKLRRMNVKCDEALSGIDVALTKRYDTLSKMLEVTKGYAKHEKETLIGVISMRQPSANSTVAEKSECAAEMTAALKAINVVVERYPELKADKAFGNLSNSITEIEENLQASRRVYNSNVSRINQAIVTFPTSLVAGKAGIVKRDFFEAEENKRQDVKMEF